MKPLIAAALFPIALCNASPMPPPSAESVREIQDTLYSSKGDRVIISYNISHQGTRTTFLFTDAKKKLGSQNARRFKKLSDVAVMFFDRTGNYQDLKLSGLSTNAFMIPSGVSYKHSADGYFIVSDNPSLTFDAPPSTTVHIPIFLSHYQGKHRYQVFESCGNLTLSLNSPPASANTGAQAKGNHDATQSSPVTITTTEEIEEATATLSATDEARIRINNIKNLLTDQTAFPLSEELTHEVAMLRELRYKITDNTVSSEINDVLANYEQKKKELEEQAGSEAKNAQAAAEAQAKREAQQAQARQDSIAALQQQQAEKSSKRNTWLIIGGGILAVLMFVGNQVIQQVRNKKSQMKMIQMQQEMANKAKEEARRRSQELMKSSTRQLRNVGKQAPAATRNPSPRKPPRFEV